VSEASVVRMNPCSHRFEQKACGYREVELCASPTLRQREHNLDDPTLNSAPARVMPSSISVAPADFPRVALPAHDLQIWPLCDSRDSRFGLTVGIEHILPHCQSMSPANHAMKGRNSTKCQMFDTCQKISRAADTPGAGLHFTHPTGFTEGLQYRIYQL
jgi:hypothetical protein